MRAVVTGGRGFIGSRLVRRLRADERFSMVAGASRSDAGENRLDVTSGWEVGAFLERFRPDVVFHLAGNPSSRPDVPCRHLWDVNVGGTLNVLAHAPAGCRVVLASSATVYGDLAAFTWAREDMPTLPTSVYGASKVAAEALLEAHTALGKVRGVALRLVAVVGPGGTHGLLPDLLRKLRADGPSVDLLGARPGTVKPYVHVDDVCDVMADMVFHDCSGPFNVGPGDCLSVEVVAETVMQAVGARKEIAWAGEDSLWPGDNRTVRVDCTRLRNVFPGQAGWTSQEALRRAAREC